MSKSLRRLADAMQIWHEHRTAPRGSDADLLLQHAELADLLEPLFVEAAGDDATAAVPAAERRFGEFRIEREIGRGGMGIVYAAVQESLGRRVALKVLGGATPREPRAIARFRRESELLARLRHDHLVPVFEAGMADGVPWFAMELVDGCSLADVLRHLRSQDDASCDGESLARAHAAALGDAAAGARLRANSHTAAIVQCLLPIAAALACAHDQHILHRDVKPANILLRRDGVPLLGDFGLARDVRDPALTQVGDFAGTPYYVSPEQAAGRDAVDERADVFSLGVVFYELLLRQRPFDGASNEAVLHSVQHTEPPALVGRSSGLSADVAAVLEKALQKRPQDRYASMADFAADLRCLVELRPVSVRRSGPVTRWIRSVRRQPARAAVWGLTSVSLVTVVALSAYLWWQQPRLAAATRAELLPAVEELLQDAMLAQYTGDYTSAAEALRAADELLPDLTEVYVARMRQHRRAGTAAPLVAEGSPLSGNASELTSQATMPLPATEPSSAVAWFVRGSTALEAWADSGDTAMLTLAASALRRAIDRAPAPRAIYHCQLLRALICLGDHDAMRTLVADVRHLWPDSPFACYWRGIAMQELDPDEATAEVRRVLAIQPQHVQLHALLASLLLETSPAEAVRCADFAIAARPDWVAPRLIKARALLAAGRADEALTVCDEAVVMAPGSGAAQATRGRVLGHIGRFDEALAACDRGAQLAPHTALPFVHRADVLDRLGKRDLALAAAEQALRSEPGSLRAAQAVAVAQLIAGRHEQAAASFERVVAIAPKHYKAWVDLGQARRQCGQLDAAEAAIRESLRLQPEFSKAHLQLAFVWSQREDHAAAEACLREAIRCDPKDAEVRVRLAALLFRRGAFAEGQAECGQARALWPDLENGYTLAIQGYRAEGRPADAIRLQIEFCASRPASIDIRIGLCKLLLRDLPDVADLGPAEQALIEAERLESGRGDVAYWSGELALRRGENTVAKASFERAVADANLAEPLRMLARERLAALPQ